MPNKDEERAPLLTGSSGPSYGQAPPSAPPISESNEVTNSTTYVTVPPIGPDELPPPYTPSPQDGTPMVNCRVCNTMIDISSKKEQHVVKCNSCGEATPIKSAPPGKKYVRCPCNCLLICKATSQRIACPRTNCKRVINLAPSPVTPPAGASVAPGMCHVSCGHCRATFLFNTLTNALARCPHCRKISTVGSEFARSRGLIFLVIAIVFLIIAIGVTVGTLSVTNKAIYVVYVLFFVAFVLFFFRAMYYFTMKVSQVDGPA